MALFDEVRQEMHHAQVVLTAAESSREQEVLSFRTVRPPSSLWTLQSRVKCVEQSLVGQCSQAALQVQQVGVASSDASVRVGQPVDEGARV